MITIIIPTLNADKTLVCSLAALVAAAAEGFVREVIISDGGSTDETCLIAEDGGCVIVTGGPGRGAQLRRGAAAAKADWLLFLHADTELEPGWQREAAAFIARENQKEMPCAAAFTFRFADTGWRPWFVERMVAVRCRLLALPYGDQGLLISRTHYRSLGGFPDIALMEDVALARRIGRRRLTMLKTCAWTSAGRYRHDGYVLRTGRNLLCLSLYFLRVPPRLISRIYG